MVFNRRCIFSQCLDCIKSVALTLQESKLYVEGIILNNIAACIFVIKVLFYFHPHLDYDLISYLAITHPVFVVGVGFCRLNCF